MEERIQPLRQAITDALHVYDACLRLRTSVRTSIGNANSFSQEITLLSNAADRLIQESGLDYLTQSEHPRITDDGNPTRHFVSSATQLAQTYAALKHAIYSLARAYLDSSRMDLAKPLLDALCHIDKNYRDVLELRKEASETPTQKIVREQSKELRYDRNQPLSLRTPLFRIFYGDKEAMELLGIAYQALERGEPVGEKTMVAIREKLKAVNP